MNAIRLRYAMDVVKYLRGHAEATPTMVEHVLTEVMPELKPWDFGLKDSEVQEAEDELGCIAESQAAMRDDDPGSVGYIARKDAMERG